MNERRKTVTPGFGGWAHLLWMEIDSATGVVTDREHAYARFELRRDRLVVAELYFPPPFSVSDLRALRLGEFEAWVNAEPELRNTLLGHIDEVPVPQLATAASYFGTPGTSKWLRGTWVGRMYEAQLEDSDEPTVRPAKLSRITSIVKPEMPDLHLEVPAEGTKPYPSEFFTRVAELYGAAVSAGSRSPAGDIADANGVPVTTVHRWIRRSRQLGELPSGSQGKKG